MLKKFLKNRQGTAEIIGSALFIVIILFFFSNVYLWHDQATREMNNVLLERMNASVSMVAIDEGVNVTNNGGVTFALSRLWIIDDVQSQHYYADLENIPGHRIWVVAGQSVQINLDPTAQPPVTGSPIPVTWSDTLNLTIIQYASPTYGVTLRILTELGSTASCVIRAVQPTISIYPAAGRVGDLVALIGANFAPTSLMTIEYDGITVPTSPARPLAQADGSLPPIELNIPPSAFGIHTLTVTDNSGSSASVPFNVDTASLTLVPEKAPKGTSVIVSGNGFAPTSDITLSSSIDGVSFTPSIPRTRVTGSFTASFIVPTTIGSTIHSFRIDATDNSNSASAQLAIA